MALPTTVEQLPGNAWRYTFGSLTAPIDIYINGELIRTRWDSRVIILGNNSDVQPDIAEAIESGDTTEPLTVTNASYATLQWRGVQGASYYMIQEDGAEIGRIEHIGTGRYHQYVLPYGRESITIPIVVVSYDGRDNSGGLVEYYIYQVNHPFPPLVAYSYNSTTGDLTVDDA